MTSALTANSWVSSWPARSPLLLSSLSHVHISATQSPILSTGEEARRLKLGRLRRTLLATTYLHTSKSALPSEERQVGRPGLQLPPLVLGRLAGANCESELGCRHCLSGGSVGRARRWRESGGSEPYADGGRARMGASWAGSPNVHASERLERGNRRLSSFLIVSTLKNEHSSMMSSLTSTIAV